MNFGDFLTPLKKSPKIFKIIALFLMVVFLAGQYLQLQTGYADNGDFRRANQLFTDSPVGFSKQPPEFGTPEHTLRYYHYWQPEWNFRPAIPSLYSAFSSTILLWIPGALLNYLFISDTILYVVVLSIFPRLLAGLSLFGLIVYFSIHKRYALFLLALILLPLVLLLNTSNNAAYFNSFYQESGSLVYFLLLITWLLLRGKIANHPWVAIGYGLLFLTTTAKASNFYFPFLFIPVLFDLKKTVQSPKMAALVLALTLLPVAFTITLVGDRSPANRYNSLFFGVLVSSKHPEQRLIDIGITDPDAIKCRGGFFSELSMACYEKYRDKVSLKSIGIFILREPNILVNHAERLANTMQQTDNDRGKYAPGDETHRNEILYNGWARLKENHFPKGWTFYWFLLAQSLIALLLKWKNSHPLVQDFSTLNIILLGGIWLDMWVAIFGDGIADLVKHLFMANLMFDLSIFITIAILGIALLEPGIFRANRLTSASN